MTTRFCSTALLATLAGTAAGQAVSPITPEGANPPPDRQQDRQQTRPEDGPRIAPRQEVTYTLEGGASFDGRGDGDGAVGEVRTLRLPASLKIGVPIDQKNRLTVSLSQESSFYDFENFTGFSGFALDPLDYGLEAGIGATWLHIIDAEWAIVGSLSAGFSGELGADFQDGLTFGALAGARYRLSEDVSLGAALSVRTRIEEDPFVIPVPTFDIQASDYFSLHLGPIDTGPGAADIGLRGEYEVSDELALGGYIGVRFHQYRLRADNPVVSAGVLEDFVLPIGGYVRYDVSPNTKVIGNLLFIPHRELELQDSNGNNLGDIELFPSLGVGVGLEISL